MIEQPIRKDETRQIDVLVARFHECEGTLTSFLKPLVEYVMSSKELMTHVHSVKWRMKDPDRLRDKLARKIIEARKKGGVFGITPGNLFQKVNDLVGIRILHLYTSQFPDIHARLLEILDEGQYRQYEDPFARSWDDETKNLFRQWGIRVEDSPSMYTSVHYVIESNHKTRFTCEIQVRTLMEEVWGEVDHRINYPHSTQSIACSEQIRALARLTSGCGRLVDSIFRSHAEFQKRKPVRK